MRPEINSRPFVLAKVDTGELAILGYSVAGEETAIVCPELNVCFDIGRCPVEALPVDNILLSHAHTDHSAGILYYFAQRDFQAIEGGKVFMPKRHVAGFAELMRAWGKFEGHVPPYQVVPVLPDNDYQLRRDLIVRTFNTPHAPGSVGYSVIEVRQKLKEEYIGLTGSEIVELKNQGKEISRRLEIPLIAFLGDTAKFDYASIPWVRDAKILLIECTFFDDDHKSRSKAGKHIHVDDLPGILEGMQNEKIVITHVTRRTNLGLAKKLLRKSLPAEIWGKVTFLMDRKNLCN